MSTLVIGTVFPPAVGGSGRWLYELYSRLSRHEYSLAVGRHPRQDAFDRTHDLTVERCEYRFSDIGMCSARGLVAYSRALRTLLDVAVRHRVQRVHCGTPLPDGWLGLMLKRLCGLPYLCFVHGEEINPVSNGADNGVFSSRQLRWMMHQVLRGADLLVANSQNTSRIIREELAIRSVPVVVLHPGVDTRRFAPAAPDKSFRHHAGWGERRVVLTVGRLQKRKGHDRMIDALPAIRRRVPNVLYAIVGDGRERAALERRVLQTGVGDSVQFLGEVDETRLVSYYQQADLFALPNRQVGRDLEGFGMVLLEAQACGKPVIAGLSGGVGEAVLPSETGLLVSCESADALASAVVALLDDPDRRHRMGETARSWMVERFDWARRCGEADELFARLPRQQTWLTRLPR